MNRAFTVLDVRSLDDQARTIEGIASTPTTDRMGDVVEPLGAKFKLPMPLLWQHNHSEPVGTVEFAQPTRSGIPFRARIAKVTEPGTLKSRTDEAWDTVRSGLVRAVSIGFRALASQPLKSGGTRFTSWEWLELSLVTIPANSDAMIVAVKAFDRAQRATAGHRAGKGSVRLIPRAY